MAFSLHKKVKASNNRRVGKGIDRYFLFVYRMLYSTRSQKERFLFTQVSTFLKIEKLVLFSTEICYVKLFFDFFSFLEMI